MYQLSMNSVNQLDKFCCLEWVGQKESTQKASSSARSCSAGYDLENWLINWMPRQVSMKAGLPASKQGQGMVQTLNP